MYSCIINEPTVMQHVRGHTCNLCCGKGEGRTEWKKTQRDTQTNLKRRYSKHVDERDGRRPEAGLKAGES
jgi:hypothetical protein